MPRPQLRTELFGRVDDGIDLAAEGRLCSGQRRDDLAKGRCSDHEQVHVAGRSKPAARGRSVDEGDGYSIRQREKGSSHLIDESRGLREDALQLFEDRRRGVGLVEDLISSDRAPKNPRGGELLELSRNGPDRGAADPDQLPDVEGLIGMREEPAQHLPSGLSEERGGRVG